MCNLSLVYILFSVSWLVCNGKYLTFLNNENTTSISSRYCEMQEMNYSVAQNFNQKIEINIYDPGATEIVDCKTFAFKSRVGVIDAPMQFILIGAMSDYLNFSCQLFPIELDEAAQANRDLTHKILQAPYIVMSLTLPGAEIPEGADVTSYFAESVLSFAAGLPRRKLRLLTSLRPFEPLVWLLVLISFLPAAVASILILQRHTTIIQRGILVFNRDDELHISMSFSSISTYFLRSLVAQDNYSGKIISLPPLRFIIASWQFFAIITCTAYVSRLFNIIRNPTMSKIPTTWEKLQDSQYKLGTPNIHLTRRILQGDLNISAKYNNISEKYRHLSSESRLKYYKMKHCMGNATVRKDFVCVVTDNRLVVNAHKHYVTTEGTTLVKISRDRYFPVFRLWIYKFANLTREINTTGGLSRFFESGFTQKWESDFNRYAFWVGLRNAKNESKHTSPIQSAIRRSKDRERRFIALRHYDITGILIILVIGLIISSLTFLTEIYEVGSIAIAKYLPILQHNLWMHIHRLPKLK